MKNMKFRNYGRESLMEMQGEEKLRENAVKTS
jgi:hypothetical protein